MNPSNQQPEQPGWPALVMKELVSISERHSVVLLIATILLILLEVEAPEGWPLAHRLEVVGVMVLFSLAWAARPARKVLGRPIR